MIFKWMIYLFLFLLGLSIFLPILDVILSCVKTLFDLLPKSKKEKAKEAHINKIELRQETEAELKGASFESKLRDQILYYFPGSKVRQNIIIRNGKFSKEIDLIALTPMGFILIEAKNYNHCELVGEVKEKDWKVIYNENKQFHLYNPIYQINSGVWNVKKHLPNIYLDKAVVFSDNCKLPQNVLNEDCVFTYSSFVKRLMELSELLEETSPKYTDTFIEQLDSKLEQIDTVSREEHIKNVEEIRKANA